MQRKYLKAGAEFNNTTGKQLKIETSIKTLQWFNLPPDTNLPFSQGYALKEMVQQMGYKTDKIGYGTYDNSLALLAMRNNYQTGEIRRATLYAIDTGVELISIAVDEETATDI